LCDRMITVEIVTVSSKKCRIFNAMFSFVSERKTAGFMSMNSF